MHRGPRHLCEGKEAHNGQQGGCRELQEPEALQVWRGIEAVGEGRPGAEHKGALHDGAQGERQHGCSRGPCRRSRWGWRSVLSIQDRDACMPLQRVSALDVLPVHGLCNSCVQPSHTSYLGAR